MFSAVGRPLQPLAGQERDTTGPWKTNWVESEGRTGSESGLLVIQLRVNVDEHHFPSADGAMRFPCLSLPALQHQMGEFACFRVFFKSLYLYSFPTTGSGFPYHGKGVCFHCPCCSSWLPIPMGPSDTISGLRALITFLE